MRGTKASPPLERRVVDRSQLSRGCKHVMAQTDHTSYARPPHSADLTCCLSALKLTLNPKKTSPVSLTRQSSWWRGCSTHSTLQPLSPDLPAPTHHTASSPAVLLESGLALGLLILSGNATPSLLCLFCRKETYTLGNFGQVWAKWHAAIG